MLAQGIGDSTKGAKAIQEEMKNQDANNIENKTRTNNAEIATIEEIRKILDQ